MDRLASSRAGSERTEGRQREIINGNWSGRPDAAARGEFWAGGKGKTLLWTRVDKFPVAFGENRAVSKGERLWIGAVYPVH